MSEKPTALRLAEILEKPGYGWNSTPIQCAAELRRLHGEVEALRAALQLVRMSAGWQALSDESRQVINAAMKGQP